MSHELLIAEYLKAFRAANTMNDPPDITYENGWFTFKSPRTYPRKYRRDAVEAMMRRLHDRAAPSATKRGAE